MAVRNSRPDARTGVSPQVGVDASPARANLEARSQVEDLQRKAYGTDGTPSSVKLYAYRDEGLGPPFLSGTITRTSGNPDADLPGTGLAVPPLYKGERLSVDFMLGAVSVVGSTYLLLELLGSVGQGQGEKTITSVKLVPPVLSNAPYFAGTVIDLTEAITGARLRFRAGSGGGTITINAGTACRQHWTLYVPRPQ